MGLDDMMTAEVSAVFFSSDDFAKPALYNDVDVLVVPEIGEDNRKGNTFSNEGRSGIAYFWVKETDVLWPEASDVIVYAGVTWNVARVIESGGGMHRVECTTRESAFG